MSQSRTCLHTAIRVYLGFIECCDMHLTGTFQCVTNYLACHGGWLDTSSKLADSEGCNEETRVLNFSLTMGAGLFLFNSNAN